MILVSKLTHPLNLTRKIVALLPAYAACEPRFGQWLGVLVWLARQKGGPLHFYGTPDSLNALKDLAPTLFSSIKVFYHEFTDWNDFLIMGREITRDDLLLIISAREDTISHIPQLNDIPNKLAKHFVPYSFVILYPEQIAMRVAATTD